MSILGLGAAVFDKNDRSMAVMVYAIGFVIAGLCIIVPWVAKHIEPLGEHNVHDF